MKLPPVWAYKPPTSVKAKTSAPTLDSFPSCAALTRDGLLQVTHTGSRERGGGLRQTLERGAGMKEWLTLGRKSAAGTVWATPLEHTVSALTTDVAVLSLPNQP
ncbi:hypothetical protein [Ktedonospora formicarum]|uniref:Uncharacterized protein n=1 Tax=Ktedonospora formicarum TaxID=2778364 RepID=A0A8J3HQZ8_9CHLR|nr:hypothetical protein [Ktedonospora formicarum]GHO42227.1 hypothetical protein KSX_03900 [Ktedonospora formicarum]GHO47612.1 hypothetical protein KSX_57750 [Ktedonospora formicarum]